MAISLLQMRLGKMRKRTRKPESDFFRFEKNDKAMQENEISRHGTKSRRIIWCIINSAVPDANLFSFPERHTKRQGMKRIVFRKVQRG